MRVSSLKILLFVVPVASVMAQTPKLEMNEAAGGSKAGLESCAWKYEGRWEHVSGMGGMKVVFRSSQATITEGPGGDMVFDCFTDGDKVVSYKADRLCHSAAIPRSTMTERYRRRCVR